MADDGGGGMTFDKLDTAGVGEVLKSGEMAAVITGLAQSVAANVARGDVVVDSYVTDRAAASVTIREPQAMLWQARDGILTKAASAAGLEVTERRT